MQLRQRGDLDKAVGAASVAKRHVIGHIHLVDADVGQLFERRLFLLEGR